MDSSVSPKDESWFMRVCHHISNAVYKKRPVTREEDDDDNIIITIGRVQSKMHTGNTFENDIK
jgi:hypothetical protein